VRGAGLRVCSLYLSAGSHCRPGQRPARLPARAWLCAI